MTKEELRTYQLIQLELLDYFHTFCVENNLCYYLIGGTLLGAVRHKGFIPWDPDIDVAIPRKDYEIFKEKMLDNGNDKYYYSHYLTEKNHASPHALLRLKKTHVIINGKKSKHEDSDGIYLDIFPLDYPPENKRLQKKQENSIKRIRKIIYYKRCTIFDKNKHIKNALKWFISICLKPISLRFLNKRLDKIEMKYSNISSNYLVSMSSHYSYSKQMIKKDVYGKPKNILFEGKYYYSPNNEKAYLEQIFGKNYMEPPNESSRYDFLESFDFVDDRKYETES